MGGAVPRVHDFVRRSRPAGTPDGGPSSFHGLLTARALAGGLADQLATIAGRLQSAESLIRRVDEFDFGETVLLGLQQALQVCWGGVLEHFVCW